MSPKRSAFFLHLLCPSISRATSRPPKPAMCLASTATLLRVSTFIHGAANLSSRAGMATAAARSAGCDTSTRPIGLKSFETRPPPSGLGFEDTIVFVHGWPDDHRMFDKQVAHLSDRYRCITTDLPGFSVDDDDCEPGAKTNGYTIDEIVGRLETTIEEAGDGSPVTVVAHDWGCTYSFLVEKRRPELFERIVAIDVGGAVEPSPLGLLAIVSYHLWLIAAFRVGGRIGDAMARSFAWLVGAPDGARVATAASCYPYYHWWKRKLDKSQEQIKALVPKAPVLFLYGTAGYKSYLLFHADWWAKKIDEREGSASVALPGSKHWITDDQPDELNRRLDAFLEQK